MAYSEKAKALRRCTGFRKDGEPCEAYAAWGDPRGLCAAHGRHHAGPLPKRYAPRRKSSYPPCRCPAYSWPHRPGGGLCEWPELPEYRLTTPAGTKSVFNGEPWRFFSLGRRLNQERMEKRYREPPGNLPENLPEAEPEEGAAGPGPRPTPEPELTRDQEIALILERIGISAGGR